jgi:RimJ/RimL family protein N-acetyltransferase
LKTHLVSLSRGPKEFAVIRRGLIVHDRIFSTVEPATLADCHLTRNCSAIVYSESPMKAPEQIQTARLLLRRPELSDAEAIFHRYASDPAVTRYMSWPTHRSVADTQAFLAWDESEWVKWPASSYLIFLSAEDRLLGSTGLSFKTPTLAVTGYVLAQDAWGKGYATEALKAMVELARQTGVERLEAVCHVDHSPSAHVLEKCGFQRETTLRESLVFPNLAGEERSDVLSFTVRF